MGTPSIKVSTWPIDKKGKLIGLAKVTIGDVISVYPIRINDGKNGYFLGMPQVPDRDGDYRDVFFPVSKDAREILTEAVAKTFKKDKSMYREYPGEEPIQTEITVRPYQDSTHNLIGYVSIGINGMFRVENVRLYQGEKGNRYTLFPERGFTTDGETVYKGIFEFKKDWDKTLRERICNEYDQVMVRIKGKHIQGNHDKQGRELSYDELMEIRLKHEAERRNEVRHKEERTEPEQEDPDQEIDQEETECEVLVIQ